MQTAMWMTQSERKAYVLCLSQRREAYWRLVPELVIFSVSPQNVFFSDSKLRRQRGARDGRRYHADEGQASAGTTVCLITDPLRSTPVC